MLLFVTDDALQPFWEDLPVALWMGFELHPFFGPPPRSPRRPYSRHFANLIDAVLNDRPEEYCLITDARFGAEPDGGMTLLNALAERPDGRFVRGCVYSSQPGQEANLLDPARSLLYAKRDTDRAAELAAVLTFLRTGRRPPGPPAAASRVSDAIHFLLNIPILCERDVLLKMTACGAPLSDRDRRICAEIDADCFGAVPGDEPALVRAIDDALAAPEVRAALPPGVIDGPLATATAAIRAIDLASAEPAAVAARVRALEAASAAVAAVVAALRAARRAR